MSVIDGRSDPALAKALVRESNGAVKRLASQGIRFQLRSNRQAHEIDAGTKFCGKLAVKVESGGRGLTQ